MVTVAKHLITFLGGKPDEEVEADNYVDKPPLVDFRGEDSKGDIVTVARYRAEEIRRILLR